MTLDYYPSLCKEGYSNDISVRGFCKNYWAEII